jgi:hypothetical protein
LPGEKELTTGRHGEDSDGSENRKEKRKIAASEDAYISS